MRRKIVAGNWKMNMDLEGARKLSEEVRRLYWSDTDEEVQVILAPPAPFLEVVHQETGDKDRVAVAAQNMHFAESGAYTGEISASMLRSVGCEYVIIGHSERRQYFGETNDFLAKKVTAALSVGLEPIYCFGETLEEREAGKTMEVVEQQVKEGIFHLQTGDLAQVILAYEPVWAIGTGKTATPEQAQEVHAFVRKLLTDQFGEEAAANCSILYGGSVKPGNAWELFSQEDIDGGLVGGASLNAESFIRIVKAMEDL